MNSIVGVKRTKALVVAALWLTVFVSAQYTYAQGEFTQEELLLLGRAALAENPKDCVAALKYLFAYQHVAKDDQLDEEMRGCEAELRRLVEQSRRRSETSNEQWNGAPRIVISTDLYRGNGRSRRWEDFAGTVEDFVRALTEDELAIRPRLEPLQSSVSQADPVGPSGR